MKMIVFLINLNVHGVEMISKLPVEKIISDFVFIILYEERVDPTN